MDSDVQQDLATTILTLLAAITVVAVGEDVAPYVAGALELLKGTR